MISIPLCYLFTYTFKYEIFGTRSSYIVAIIFLVIIYSVIYCKEINYKSVLRKSRKRILIDSKQISNKGDNGIVGSSEGIDYNFQEDYINYLK